MEMKENNVCILKTGYRNNSIFVLCAIFALLLFGFIGFVSVTDDHFHTRVISEIENNF